MGHGPATQPQFFCALTRNTRLSLSPHFLIEGNHLYPPPRTPPVVGTLCPAAGPPFGGDGTNMGQEKTSGRGEHPNRLVAAPPRTIVRPTADAAVEVRLFVLAPSITSVFGTVCPAASSVVGDRKANREHKAPRETERRDHGTYTRKRSGTGGGARVDHGLYACLRRLSLSLCVCPVYGSHGTNACAPRACMPFLLLKKRDTLPSHTLHTLIYSNTTNFLHLSPSATHTHTRSDPVSLRV